MFSVSRRRGSFLSSRRLIAAAAGIAVLVGTLAVANAATSAPSVKLADLGDGLVVASLSKFPATTDIEVVAEVKGGSGEVAATTNAKGSAVIAFEAPTGFTGDVTVTATASTTSATASLTLGAGEAVEEAPVVETPPAEEEPETEVPTTEEPATGTATDIAFPIGVSVDKSKLVDQSGSAVVLAADTNWNLLSNGSTADVTTYLEARAEQGFNAVLTSVLEPGQASGDSAAFSGSMATPQDAFFARTKEYASIAEDNGIELMILPAWSQGLAKKNDSSWTAASATSYGAYLKAEFATVDNVLWVTGGDWGSAANEGLCPLREQTEALGTALHGGTALVTYHTGYGMKSSDCYGDASWLDVDGTYWDFNYGNPSSSYTLNADVYGKGRPVVMLETGYEGPFPSDADPTAMTAYTSRYQSWTQMTAGGAGFSFGSNGTYNMPGGNGRSWTQTLAEASGKQQGYVTRLFQSVGFAAMKPDLDNQVLIGGYGKAGSMDFASATASTLGAVVYASTSTTLEIDTTGFVNGGSAKWYDPTSGQFTDAGSFESQAPFTAKTPGANSVGDADWVLVLTVG